ncbi:MAG: MerR family transcriptional regulator [Emergencia sp.]
MKRKEYYKIGEISALYGIGTDSLRYYEEIGILKPRRDDNGYRMYSISDIRTLNILRELRSIGFSMAEIKAHLSDFNLEKTLALFQREIEAIDEKSAQLQRLRDQLSGRIEEINRHVKPDPDHMKPAVYHLPERRILSLTENVYRDDDLDYVIKKLQKENEDQLYIIGNGGIGATIPLDYVMSGGYGHFNSVFCLTEDDDYDGILPEGDYLCSTVKGSYRTVPAAWNALFAELRRLDLSPAGDPMERYIIDNHDTSDESEYITQLQIPLR